jgi:16S rRNA (guanine527-N7)-methyltransferase
MRTPSSTFAARALQLGVSLSSTQVQQFSELSILLAEANTKLNLTRVPPEEFETLHYLDSLAAACCGFPMQGELLDIGSGAGFPGLPLAIAFPSLKVTMLDATRKKVTHIRSCLEALGLKNARAEVGRAEELAAEKVWREHFDIVTARAVAAMPVLAELMLPMVKPGGCAVALKSAEAQQETAETSPAYALLGADEAVTVRVTLPETEIERLLVVIPKRKRTPRGYPRRYAEIRRSPLSGRG